jgi:hypothetical protein
MEEWAWMGWLFFAIGLLHLYIFWRNRFRFGRNVYHLLLTIIFMNWGADTFGWFDAAMKRSWLFYNIGVLFFGIGYLTCWWLLGKPEKRPSKNEVPG